jgi:hypothetical protein
VEFSRGTTARRAVHGARRAAKREGMVGWASRLVVGGVREAEG